MAMARETWPWTLRGREDVTDPAPGRFVAPRTDPLREHPKDVAHQIPFAVSASGGAMWNMVRDPAFFETPRAGTEPRSAPTRGSKPITRQPLKR